MEDTLLSGIRSNTFHGKGCAWRGFSGKWWLGICGHHGHPPRPPRQVWGHCLIFIKCAAQGEPPFIMFKFLGGESGSFLDGANCAGRGVRPKVPLPESTLEDERGGPSHSPLGAHNCWTPIYQANGKSSRCAPFVPQQKSMK